VVSRIINNDPRLMVRAETRERVLTAIRTLGYHPNAAARSLRTAHAGAVGLIIPDFANPIYAEIIKGAEGAARERDSVLLTGTADQEADPELYPQLLASGRVDGLLLAAQGLMPAAVVESLLALGRPVVRLNQKTRGGRCILLDDEAAARMAVNHLLQLGHARIAHIAGPAGVDTAQRRKRGFIRAVSEADIEVAGEYVVTADYTTEGGERAMNSLLALPEPPTAVFVANVASAIGALSAVRASGWLVPGDVSLVAVHDIPLAAYLSPPLTTVRMPLRELGRAGVVALDQPGPETQVVRRPMDLIVRGTTDPPRSRRRR
jgi:LacI family transcriptional regulator